MDSTKWSAENFKPKPLSIPKKLYLGKSWTKDCWTGIPCVIIECLKPYMVMYKMHRRKQNIGWKSCHECIRLLWEPMHMIYQKIIVPCLLTIRRNIILISTDLSWSVRKRMIYWGEKKNVVLVVHIMLVTIRLDESLGVFVAG